MEAVGHREAKSEESMSLVIVEKINRTCGRRCES